MYFGGFLQNCCKRGGGNKRRGEGGNFDFLYISYIFYIIFACLLLSC